MNTIEMCNKSAPWAFEGAHLLLTELLFRYICVLQGVSKNFESSVCFIDDPDYSITELKTVVC